MRRTMLENSESISAFRRHPTLPVSLPPEEDNDDYEDFEDEEEMMQVLWHRGEEAYMDELMVGEDY